MKRRLGTYVTQRSGAYERPLRELASDDDMEGGVERKDVAYSTLCKELSTAPTKQIALEVELSNRSKAYLPPYLPPAELDMPRLHPLLEKAGLALKALPQVTVQVTATALKMSPPTARSALNVLVEIGVLTETSSRKRDKTYVYKKYLEILEEGCEPLGAST